MSSSKDALNKTINDFLLTWIAFDKSQTLAVR